LTIYHYLEEMDDFTVSCYLEKKQTKGFYFVPPDVCIVEAREIPRSLGNMGGS